MKIAIIHNKDFSGVINNFGMQNREIYSFKTVRRVAEALIKNGHNVEILDGNMHIIESLGNFMPKANDGEQPGMVFNMAYGIQGESRYTHIPSLLEMLGLPYTGSSPSGHTLALDKVLTKIIWQKNGLPTPDFWVFSNSSEDMSMVRYPVIIKPKMESVSFGLKVVDNIEDLRIAVDFIITEYKQQALVEQFIRGREFAVGILGNDPIEAFPVLEFDLNNDPDAIQSVDDKKFNPRPKICPADLPHELANRIIEFCIASFKVLQLRDFARVDVRMDENNHIYLLEINSMASLGQNGSFLKAALAAGYDFSGLVNKIVDVAAKRYFGNHNQIIIQTAKEKSWISKIRIYLKEHSDEIDSLLSKSVNFNTHVSNIQGVNLYSGMLTKEFENLGFTRNEYPQSEVGNLQFYSNTKDQIADVLFIANLDNSVSTFKHYEFFKTDQKYFGPGIFENKGDIVSLITALKIMRYCHLLKKTRIHILFIPDFNLKSKYSNRYIKEISKTAKNTIILGENGPDSDVYDQTYGLAYYHFKLDDLQYIENQDKSTFFHEMNEIILNLHKLSEPEKALISISDFELKADYQNLKISDSLSIEVAYIEPGYFEKLDKKIKKVLVHKLFKSVKFELIDIQHIPLKNSSEGSKELIKKIINSGEKFDGLVKTEKISNFSCISFTDDSTNSIGGFGIKGGRDERKQEYILKHSFNERTTLLATLINELTQKGKI